MEVTSFVVEDLKFLLALDYHQFWSQVVFDKTLQSVLEEILQRLPRPHDLDFEAIPIDCKALMDDISHKIFLVFVRMCTFKESKANFMSADYFGKLIYDHFVIDIPRLMDLCILFHPVSPKIVAKMVENVFKCQKNYESDLKDTLESIMTSMGTVGDRADVLIQQSNCNSEEKLEELRDIVSYVCDISVSVAELLNAFSRGARYCHQVQFEARLTTFYHSVLVSLIRYLLRQQEAGHVSEDEVSLLMSRLSLSRQSCIQVVRHIINTNCLQPILEGHAGQDGEDCFELFCDILTTCLAEGCILLDYANYYPLDHDLDLLTQANLDVDQARVDYILDGIQAIANEMTANVLKFETQKFNQEIIKKSDHEQAALAEASAAPEANLIGQVKDLLPDLGDGFVLECLKYFDQSPEKVINALFEENLPPHLLEMDRSKSLEVKPAVVKPQVSTEFRANAFDGDEFDINTNDNVDVSRIHRGKKRMAKDAKALLDDKSDLKDMKDRFSSLGIVTDEIIITPGAYMADYDDEYDDTYDDSAVGQPEPDELTERRPFVLPRALGGGHVGKVVEEADEEESDDDQDKKKSDNFVRNPEEVRAEAEQRRQSKLRHRGRGGGHSGPDVVGKPKGQGQEKQVLVNRARKNANKGKHHRAMAERKQGRGMF